MGLFSALNVSASGLTAERLHLDLIANNIANANVTRTAGGSPYRRKVPVFAGGGFSSLFPVSGAGGLGGPQLTGVQVVGILEDPSPFKVRYEPDHPDADADGYVRFPNVDILREMVDMIAASRAYEANVTAFNTAKTMAQRTLELGR